jgi:hypothetical protein
VHGPQLAVALAGQLGMQFVHEDAEAQQQPQGQLEAGRVT